MSALPVFSFKSLSCCLFQIGGREGSVKPSWESIHPTATVPTLALPPSLNVSFSSSSSSFEIPRYLCSSSQALTAPCCRCLLTAGTGEAMSRCRSWFPTSSSSQRPSPPPFPPPCWAPAPSPWWAASIPTRWTAAASSTSSVSTATWKRSVWVFIYY